MLARAGQFWRTVRHLRPVQVSARLRYRLARPRPDLAPPPPRASGFGVWQAKAARPASMSAPQRFTLLGQTEDLDNLGWCNPRCSKLWRYNLHYFDDLHAASAETRRDWHLALIERWIAENPPAQGDGWEPYPLSLRLVNWGALALSGVPLPDAAWASMAVQARWLIQRLEWHLLGNHLFANAKALMFAGILFDGSEARQWRRRAMAILAREVPEQILPDGGHFERSTMYHALALEDVLDLVNLLAARAPGQAPEADMLATDLRARVPGMLRWLMSFCHQDGEIAFFNDAAFGVAPSPPDLAAYATRLGFDKAAAVPGLYQPSGYARLEHVSAVVLADVAPVGPDYLPGHAHADTLSFELSLFGTRVVVNSGASVYGGDMLERMRQRATMAHSTLVYDGQSSSEVWGVFRTGRRARVVELQYAGNRLEAAHDGYAHLPGRPLHRRRWHLESGALEVSDEIAGGAAPALARFHLAPGIQAEAAEGIIRLTLPEGQRLRVTVEGAALSLSPGSWHPRFGVSEPSLTINAALTGARLSTRIAWNT